jgi:HPt (histidine-containing phosphotransfer) domain-containing protein
VFGTENEAPPIDLAVALDEFRGDQGLLMEVFEAFITSARERIGRINSAIAAGDTAVIKIEGHTLKGGAGVLQAKKLAAIAYELEKAGESEDLARSTQLFNRFQKEFESLVDFMKTKQP